MSEAFSWDAVRRRLAEIVDDLGRRAVLPPDEEERRLHARAAALAEVHERRDEAQTHWLEFIHAGARWLVPEAAVREVLPLRAPAPIPGAPCHILGMIASRGRVLCVNDLGLLLGLPATGWDGKGTVIVLGDGGREIGVLAEDVAGFRPTERVTDRNRGGAMRGLTDDGACLLDPSVLFDDPRVAGGEASPGPTPQEAGT